MSGGSLTCELVIQQLNHPPLLQLRHHRLHDRGDLAGVGDFITHRAAADGLVAEAVFGDAFKLRRLIRCRHSATCSRV